MDHYGTFCRELTQWLVRLRGLSATDRSAFLGVTH